MKLAVIGLSYTHPYTYSAIARRLGVDVSRVWDSEPDKAREFAERFGAVAVETPEQALEDKPDGVFATSRGPERTQHTLLCIERGIPTYVGKPMVTNRHDLIAIGDAARRTGCPILSTSVFRYAPAVRALQGRLQSGEAGTLLALHATVVHSIEMYMHEPNRWQDDVTQGGGTIMTMGVHTLDPLVALLGRGIESIYCHGAKRRFLNSLSEDTAVMVLRWRGGPLATMEIIGGFGGEYSSLEVFGSDAAYRIQIPKADVMNHLGAPLGDVDPWVEQGYVATIEAFLDMCRTGRMPITLEEMEEVMGTLLAARLSASEAQPVELADV